MFKKIVFIIAGVSSAFAMHTAELNVNQYDLEAGVKFDIGQFNTTTEPDTTFVGVTYLKGSAENDSVDSDRYDDGDYIDFNFMIKQNIKNTNFKAGVGVKAVYISVDTASVNNERYIVLPIGAELSYILPIKSTIPFKVKALASYAPQSLSFADAESFFEYRVEASAELMQRASLYVGFRNIDTDYENRADFTYNKSAYFGVKFSF